MVWRDDTVWGRNPSTKVTPKQPEQVQVIEHPSTTALTVKDSGGAVWKSPRASTIAKLQDNSFYSFKNGSFACLPSALGIGFGAGLFVIALATPAGLILATIGGVLLLGGVAIGVYSHYHGSNEDEIAPPTITELPSNWVSNTVISLQKEFHKLKAKDELQKTVDLVNSYNLVTKEISNIKESGRFAFDITTQVEPLTKDVFRQGLLFLCSIQDLCGLINSEDATKLGEAVVTLNNSIDSLKESTSSLAPQILELKENSLKYTQNRIANLITNKEQVALLLARVEECDNILRLTFDNLTKLSIEDSANVIDEIRHKLQNCIELAIEVRKEVNKACLGLEIK
jgi:hypothetical protein